MKECTKKDCVDGCYEEKEKKEDWRKGQTESREKGKGSMRREGTKQ